MSIFFPKTRKQKQREQAIQERARARLERAMIPPLVREMKRAGKEAGRLYDASESVASTEAFITDHMANIRRILAASYDVAIRGTAKRVIKDAPKGFLNISRKDLTGTVDALISEWLHTWSLTRATAISETTSSVVRNVIQAGAAEGLGSTAIARNITRSVSTLSRPRALTIARTETHAASQSSSLTIAESMGIPQLMKEWVAASDGRTRDSHVHMNGSQVAMDEAFVVNGSTLRYPGDNSGAASEVINCRCVLVYTERKSA